MNRSSSNTPFHPNDTNNDSGPNVVQESCHYAVLNLPRDATISHVQRNFKQLSRSYHPDKISATSSQTTTGIDTEDSEADSHMTATEGNALHQRRFALAQQTFVRLKTAADVLSDPVYRLAYTYGGNIAVMLVKRSQATRQEGDDDDDENHEPFNLYTLLEQHVNDHPGAAELIADFVQEYHTQQEQLRSPSSPLKLSYSMPLVVVESIASSPSLCDVSFLQRESATTRVSAKHTINHRLSTTWSATSEVQRTAQIRASGSLGLDYQLVPGTNFKSELTVPLASQSTARGRKPTLSLQTTRQTKSGTVMLVMMGGNATRRGLSSWNTTFMSSKLIQMESIWDGPRQTNVQATNTPNEPTKVVATWRLSCNPRGQLSYFMAGLKRLDFPSWACRLCLGTYPLKVSWRGAETDTFYMTYSLGMFASRVKLVRITSWDFALRSASPQSWTVTYGFKYDGQAGMSGRSPWSLLCHVESDSMSFRIPIVLETVTPISWLISVVCALFVDHHFESFVGATWIPAESQRSPQKQPEQKPQGSFHRELQPASVEHDRPWSDAIRRIAAKKRQLESKMRDGLVIHQALWSNGPGGDDRDMKDSLQYWIVNGKLGPMSMKDSRLWWHLNLPPQAKETESSSSDDPGRSWWNVWSRNPKEDDAIALGNARDVDAMDDSFGSLTIRYRYHDAMYEIYLARSDVIELPHPNATELGPANRIR